MSGDGVVTDDPDFYTPIPKYVPGPRKTPRRVSPRIPIMIGAAVVGIAGIVAVIVALTGSGSGSTHAGTTMPPAHTTNVTASRAPASTAAVAAPGGGAAGALIAGTYLVNRDIFAGHYRAQHADASCSWAIGHADGTLDIEHASGKPITITIAGSDKSLQVGGDCLFVRLAR
jgi:hypothetical protein